MADGLELHSLPGDAPSTPCSIQSAIISPSINAGETTLPALAEVDEDSTSDAKGEPNTSPTDDVKQNQTDGQGDNVSPLGNAQSIPKLKKSFATKK